jgi:hypothetical protein
MFSDLNATLMTCPLCQAEAFHRADIYDFDARHAPIVGIFQQLSSIIGLHQHTVSIGEGSGATS